MAKIKLFSGQVSEVDEVWFPVLSRFRWHLSKKGYAQRSARPGKSIFMHTVIAMTPKSLQTDHINGDKLDNRECNLRHCTTSENCTSRKSWVAPKTGYRGVGRRPNGMYQASVKKNQHLHYLGIFKTPEEAARAYDAKAESLHGSFAVLNFPNGTDQ